MESSKTRFGTNLALLFLILFFLLSYFEPHLLFSDTTPAGGDTPSHFTAAERFRDFFLNHGQITGWDYGNLAGYPLFQYYFPLPFVLCALLSLIVPLTVSFKVVTVLSVILLPVAAFYFLKKLDFQFPIPIIGSAAALLFLFVESQSMWGGNIPSALAGEFSYSLGMALALFYLADFHRGIEAKRGIWRNSFLLALTGFTHGCALLVVGTIPIFYLFLGKDTLERLKYYLKVNLLAFMLLAFWLVPWLMSQEYMTNFNFRWVFHSWSELFPTILLPFYSLAAISGLYSLYCLLRRKIKNEIDVHSRLLYLWFGALVCLIYFDIAYQLNVVDIRFVPFLQLFAVLIAAVFLGSLFQRFPIRWSFSIATVLLAMAWADYNSKTIRGWIRWNYEGFEKKPKWPALKEIGEFVEGTFEDPRVVYEHSAQHDQFGSVRTFESLPHFSGRATLEGVYLQSSVNSPFIFYLQSEVSKVSSCPLPDYHCSSLNLRRALPHLELFNASHLILRTDAAKQEARSFPDLILEKSVPPLEIYRIVDSDGRYVVPLSCKPVLYTGQDWQRQSFQWYRLYSPNSVPVVIDPDPDREDRDRFVRRGDVRRRAHRS
ncbi:MAG: 6-pyruvoyl-tetrahydropterin synthase-related protein, partial [Acidobacteriota bacterium]